MVRNDDDELSVGLILRTFPPLFRETDGRGEEKDAMCTPLASMTHTLLDINWERIRQLG
jgi:hypothetical protein